MATSDTLTLHLRRQRLVVDDGGRNVWRSSTTRRTIAADQLALIVCDVWDRHWSRGANERLLAMLPRMAEVLDIARHRGARIIHSPSETMDFYSDNPARQRTHALASAWLDAHSPPLAAPHDDPPLPVDASDGGSDTNEPHWHRAWSRQHPAIAIDEAKDAITDDGREVYALLSLWGIRQVLIMGVHTNMCILNRSFAIKRMVCWGVDIALLRDLTDAMYNPRCSPYVSHSQGTQLVIGYIEKHWCPTTTSASITA